MLRLSYYSVRNADTDLTVLSKANIGTGFSFVEKPQLVSGDRTVLQPNMVLAVDGSVSTDKFRAQVGDSFILTEDGYEPITAHPKSIDDVIIPH